MAKILIVEDDETIARAYAIALTKEGYEVDWANSVKEGLIIAEKNRPRIILLDLLLPNAGGLDFLQTFKAVTHPNVKIIVITNLASETLLKKALELGAHMTLTKSGYTPKEIVSIIQDLESGA